MGYTTLVLGPSYTSAFFGGDRKRLVQICVTNVFFPSEIVKNIGVHMFTIVLYYIVLF